MQKKQRIEELTEEEKKALKKFKIDKEISMPEARKKAIVETLRRENYLEEQ